MTFPSKGWLALVQNWASWGLYWSFLSSDWFLFRSVPCCLTNPGTQQISLLPMMHHQGWMSIVQFQSRIRAAYVRCLCQESSSYRHTMVNNALRWILIARWHFHSQKMCPDRFTSITRYPTSTRTTGDIWNRQAQSSFWERYVDLSDGNCLVKLIKHTNFSSKFGFLFRFSSTMMLLRVAIP